MTTEDNGNVGFNKPTSSSNEDLSEYTDADESISAPTEFLAEVFLSFDRQRRAAILFRGKYICQQ